MPKELVEWTNFEDDVYDAIKKAIESGFLPFISRSAVVKRNASYKSATGQRTIKIEAAIEIYRENAIEPFLISLWECKHKGTRSVEVGVVRELRSKIEEIGISRCFGAIVTTNGFQAGAIELSEEFGISLFLLENGYRLVRITKYAVGAEPEMRRVVFAKYALDDSGKVRTNVRFDDMVMSHLHRAIEAHT